MREHEEVQKMGHIVQRLVRNAIMQAVNQVIQNKTQQEAAKFMSILAYPVTFSTTQRYI